MCILYLIVLEHHCHVFFFRFDLFCSFVFFQDISGVDSLPPTNYCLCFFSFCSELLCFLCWTIYMNSKNRLYVVCILHEMCILHFPASPVRTLFIVVWIWYTVNILPQCSAQRNRGSCSHKKSSDPNNHICCLSPSSYTTCWSIPAVVE